ncbi:hypothetical protein C8R43DRAFT_1124288 [Mycena crocata]|nr:hypothetical protein C8R43DRAFT_1124288 [Mycena crocata]
MGPQHDLSVPASVQASISPRPLPPSGPLLPLPTSAPIFGAFGGVISANRSLSTDGRRVENAQRSLPHGPFAAAGANHFGPRSNYPKPTLMTPTVSLTIMCWPLPGNYDFPGYKSPAIRLKNGHAKQYAKKFSTFSLPFDVDLPAKGAASVAEFSSSITKQLALRNIIMPADSEPGSSDVSPGDLDAQLWGLLAVRARADIYTFFPHPSINDVNFGFKELKKASGRLAHPLSTSKRWAHIGEYHLHSHALGLLLALWISSASHRCHYDEDRQVHPRSEPPIPAPISVAEDLTSDPGPPRPVLLPLQVGVDVLSSADITDWSEDILLTGVTQDSQLRLISIHHTQTCKAGAECLLDLLHLFERRKQDPQAQLRRGENVLACTTDDVGILSFFHSIQMIQLGPPLTSPNQSVATGEGPERAVLQPPPAHGPDAYDILFPWYSFHEDSPVPSVRNPTHPLHNFFFMYLPNTEPSQINHPRTKEEHESWLIIAFCSILLGHPDPWHHPNFIALKEGFDIHLTTLDFASTIRRGVLPFLTAIYNRRVTAVEDVSNHLRFRIDSRADDKTTALFAKLFELRVQRYIHGVGHPNGLRFLDISDKVFTTDRYNPLLRANLVLTATTDSDMCPMDDAWTVSFRLQGVIPPEPRFVRPSYSLPPWHTAQFPHLLYAVDVYLDSAMQEMLMAVPDEDDSRSYYPSEPGVPTLDPQIMRQERTFLKGVDEPHLTYRERVNLLVAEIHHLRGTAPPSSQIAAEVDLQSEITPACCIDVSPARPGAGNLTLQSFLLEFGFQKVVGPLSRCTTHLRLMQHSLTASLLVHNRSDVRWLPFPLLIVKISMWEQQKLLAMYSITFVTGDMAFTNWALGRRSLHSVRNHCLPSHLHLLPPSVLSDDVLVYIIYIYFEVTLFSFFRTNPLTSFCQTPESLWTPLPLTAPVPLPQAPAATAPLAHALASSAGTPEAPIDPAVTEYLRSRLASRYGRVSVAMSTPMSTPYGTAYRHCMIEKHIIAICIAVGINLNGRIFTPVTVNGGLQITYDAIIITGGQNVNTFSGMRTTVAKARDLPRALASYTRERDQGLRQPVAEDGKWTRFMDVLDAMLRESDPEDSLLTDLGGTPAGEAINYGINKFRAALKDGRALFSLCKYTYTHLD